VLLLAARRTDLDGLILVRALEADAGRTIGLAWRGIDPRAPSFRAFAQFLGPPPRRARGRWNLMASGWRKTRIETTTQRSQILASRFVDLHQCIRLADLEVLLTCHTKQQ
jgi:hypothetical protein